MARKKLTEKQKTKRAFDKAYDAYTKAYDRYKLKYGGNIAPKLGKRMYKEILQDYKDAGFYHPNVAIVRDQIILTKTQAKVYSKNLQRNVREWQHEDPSNLSQTQKVLIDKLKNKKLTSDFFYEQNKFATNIVNIINATDAWDVAVGS